MSFFIIIILHNFRFGRKPTMCTSFILLIAVALSIAWTPSIEVYMFQSAFVGCITTGIFLPNYVVGELK